MRPPFTLSSIDLSVKKELTRFTHTPVQTEGQDTQLHINSHLRPGGLHTDHEIFSHCCPLSSEVRGQGWLCRRSEQTLQFRDGRNLWRGEEVLLCKGKR